MGVTLRDVRKPALTDHPIAEVLAERWSPRAFSPEPVADHVLHSIFEAARWAPSASNSQPWSFIVGSTHDPATRTALLACLNERNRSWASAAPVLGLGVAGHESDSGTSAAARAYDLGQAVGALTVQVSTAGLWMHQMAGYDRDRARSAFAIPPGFEPIAAFAIGRAGDPALLPDRLREREAALRSRKPLQAFVFAGKFGEPAWRMESSPQHNDGAGLTGATAPIPPIDDEAHRETGEHP